MFLLKLKDWAETAWHFVKKNWEWVAGIVGLVIAGIMLSLRAKKFKDIAKTFSILNMKRRKDYKDAVESHKNELEKRREVIRTYERASKEIEDRYTRKEREVVEKKKQEIKELAKKNEKDPESFVKSLAEEYNLNYVEE